MKALIQIDIPNLHSVGDSSYFTVNVGEDFENKLKEFKFNDEEVAEFRMRILKGNSSWLEIVEESDHKLLKKIEINKEEEILRKERLERLTKKEQIDLLQELGAKEFPHFEKERINLIYKLEQKKGD